MAARKNKKKGGGIELISKRSPLKVRLYEKILAGMEVRLRFIAASR